MLPLIVVFCGGNEESCSWIVTGVPVVLTVVGVPLKTPAELIPIPCDSEPETTLQVVFPRPPVELRLSEYAVQTTPSNSDALVITSGAPMRIVSVWLVVAGVVAESVTCTVKLKLPEVSGVPEMIPVAGSSVRPPGRDPAVIDAVCAPTPPKILTCVLKACPTTPSGNV